MRFRNVLLATALIAAPLAAHAQPIDGLYVGVGAGVNFMQTENFSALGGLGSGTQTLNTGWAGVGSVGWGFGNGLRAEIEGNYRYNGISGSSSTLNEQKYGVMANVLYDFNGLSPMVVPYVGAGLGYEAEKLSTLGSKASLGYQGILGAAFPIDAWPGFALTAEYRFLGLAGNRTSGSGFGAIQSTSNYNHSILLGVRFAFGNPPPAVVAPPPVAAPRSYLVFFDWDKATLTDRARGIIRDAAANAQKVAYTQIMVDGNADTSGSHVYNQGLSLRRAQTVAAELVRDGVPKGAIAITAHGDTHLLVPTGPGVREPQNRRVEIVIK